MADTASYFHAAYAVAAVLYAAYAISLVIRRRDVQRRLRDLDGGAR
jgi:hypothetical protein